MPEDTTLDLVLDPASLTPEQQAALDRPIKCRDPKPLSTHAQRMLAHGVPYHRVMRFVMCMFYFKRYQHDAHKWRKHMRCGFRSCVICALLDARKRVQMYNYLVGAIDTHFTYIRIYHPLDVERTAEQVRAIREVLRDMIPTCTLVNEGYDKGHAAMVTKVFHYAPISNEHRIAIAQALAQHKKLGPDVTMQTEIMYRNQFIPVLDAVMGSLSGADLPSDENLLGDYERAMRGVHAFAAINLPDPPKIVSTKSEDTILAQWDEDGEIVDDGNEELSHRAPHAPTCPCCGKAATHMTGWLPVDATPEEIAAAEWIPIEGPPKTE